MIMTRMIFGDQFFITILPPFLLKANLCADATLSLLYHYFAWGDLGEERKQKRSGDDSKIPFPHSETFS